MTRELWSLPGAPPLADMTSAPRPAAAGADGEARSRIRRWIRERLRRDDHDFTLPALREPERPQLPPLRRGGLAAWWSARRTRLDLDEFLRERLARYVKQCGVALERLPMTIGLDGGRVVVAPRPGAPAPADWLARYVRAHGQPALVADMERARAEAARADAALDEARERLAEARRDQECAARAPSLAWSDADATGPYGRPAVPPPWSLAIGAFVCAMVLGNAWQFALPLLRSAGVSPGEIAVEASRRPEAVALPLLLALGASACLFTFTAAALRRARALMEVVPARWHAAVHTIAGGASLAMALGLAWAILVPGAAAAGRAREVTPFLVAMALPLAMPPLVRVARRLHAARAEAVHAAAAWDQVHRAALGQWTRTSAIASAAERECAALEATRTAWTHRLYLLRSRAAEVERLAADAADVEATELRQLLDALIAALEADRRAYLGSGRRQVAASRTAPQPDERGGALEAER